MHSFWLANVSRSVLDKMLQDLRDNGNVVQESRSVLPKAHDPLVYGVTGSGITATVVYDPLNARACVTIESKPFLVPVSYIEQKVRESLRVARG
jgi:hypothetical protein